MSACPKCDGTGEWVMPAWIDTDGPRVFRCIPCLGTGEKRAPTVPMPCKCDIYSGSERTAEGFKVCERCGGDLGG